MSLDKFLIFMGVLFPLAFSAGPANVMMAAFGARFNYKKTFLFLAGVALTVLLQSLIVGFGIAEFIYKNPILFKYFKFAGAFYIVYLAYKLISSSSADKINDIEHTPKFYDGVILQLLNFKVLTYILVIFPQFIDINLPRSIQVLLLSMGHFVMVLAANSVWVLGGDWMSKKFASQSSIKIQGYIFGGMLILVAIWMLM